MFSFLSKQETNYRAPNKEQALKLGTRLLESFTIDEIEEMIDDATCLASTHPSPELPTDEKKLIAKLYHFKRLLKK